MKDIFEAGTPKYLTASSIYDALCELTQTEEMSILSEICPDVSYDNQEYYYTDKGYKLKEKFEEMSEYGEKNWLFDLVIFQLDDDSEIHDIIYEALHNSDLAKRIGFKKIFVEKLLRGYDRYYDAISAAFAVETENMNRFDYYEMCTAFAKAAEENNFHLYDNPYGSFCYHLIEKVNNLQLQKETQLITECRALLTSYDDFIRGMRITQQLYTTLEQQYKNKVLQLQAEYQKRMDNLITTAKSQGTVFELGAKDGK